MKRAPGGRETRDVAREEKGRLPRWTLIRFGWVGSGLNVEAGGFGGIIGCIVDVVSGGLGGFNVDAT